MEKIYKVAKKTIIDRKIIAFIVFFGFAALIGMLNDKYAFFDKIEEGQLILLILFFFTVPLLFILNSAKNYKTIGNIKIGTSEFLLNKNKEEFCFKSNKISNVTLEYNGIYGDSISPLLGGIASAYTKDGSGNILTFTYDNNIHKVNLVFEDYTDFTALKQIFKSLYEEYNISAEILH